MMEELETLKRRVELKKQLIELTQDEIEDLLIDIEILKREIKDDETSN